MKTTTLSRNTKFVPESTKSAQKKTNTFNTTQVADGYYISIAKEGGAVVIRTQTDQTYTGRYINSDRYTVLIREDLTDALRLIYKSSIESVSRGVNKS